MTHPSDPAAYLSIARITGDPDRLLDDYRRTADVMAEVGRDHGVLLHATAKTAEGLMIVNMWPSRDGSESAARDPRRLATLKELGIAPDRFRREHFDVAHLDFNPS